MANGSLVGMAVASFLIWNARFMGNKFDEYVSTGHVVGGDDDEELKESDGVQMAMVQNDNVDTSCAIDNDDDDDEEEEEESDSEEATETTGDGTARITQV